MPTYEYYCPSNSKTVEVMHGMSRTVQTWGELCELAEEPAGQTPTDAPVEKLMGTGMVIQKDCGSPGCCGGGCGT